MKAPAAILTFEVWLKKYRMLGQFMVSCESCHSRGNVRCHVCKGRKLTGRGKKRGPCPGCEGVGRLLCPECAGHSGRRYALELARIEYERQLEKELKRWTELHMKAE